eukprot:GHVU01078548.1.p1 GENE.GHVU01078548.1~~GHVU01078548.1.p1  ORF type:complete len:306 (-),score=33.56 GHVU01078548.1:468-1385(-)
MNTSGTLPIASGRAAAANMAVAHGVPDFASITTTMANVTGLWGEGGEALLQKYDIFHEGLNYLTAVLWLSSYAALLMKLKRDRSALGLSLQTLLALALSEVNNVFISLVLYNLAGTPIGYDFFLCDLMTLFLSVSVLIAVFRRFRNSYEEDKDAFGASLFNISSSRSSAFYRNRVHWLALYLIAFVLAVPLHALRRTALPSALSFWECFDEILLAIALLPQLYMFYSRRPRKVTHFLGTFVVFMLLARISSFCYWLLEPLFHPLHSGGRGLRMCTEGLNVCILVDFAYYYVTAKSQGFSDIALPI